MIAETLLDEGLDARLLGTQNAALLGAGQCIFEQRIEVPETQAERALELIEALGGGHGLEQEEEEEEDSEETGAGENRSRKIATGLVVIITVAVGLLIAALTI